MPPSLTWRVDKCTNVYNSLLDHTKTPWERTAIFPQNSGRVTFALNMTSATMFLVTLTSISRKNMEVGNTSKVHTRICRKRWWINIARCTISSNGKSNMGFLTAYLHLKLAHSIRQCQGHAHFDNEYLGNSSRDFTNYQWTNQSYMGFRLTYLHFIWNNSQGQSQDYAHFDNEYLENGNRYGKNYFISK